MLRPGLLPLRVYAVLLHPAGNYLGLLPFSFAFTSHIAVTLALALMVFCLSIIVSLKVQGAKFFAHFMPAGAPKLWPRC